MPTRAQDDGTTRVATFALPASAFLGPETRSALKRQATDFEKIDEMCPSHRSGRPSNEYVFAFRQCIDQYYFPPLIARHRDRYKVHIAPETLGGVSTEIIEPADGVPNSNRDRVLINLHAGAFTQGGQWGGQAESIPIAALGGITVVSVDYRMAPEHRFPAASEDVANVYCTLLREHRPENIGIYGCSAGGVLTAQSVAWMQKEGIPLPGAVGMFCGAASHWSEGDSGHLSAALGDPGGSIDDNPYFVGTAREDPLAFPVYSQQILARFPPSLLISSTRDLALSSVVHTHSRLVKLGIRADLHVWEGMGHAFLLEPEFAESGEAYEVIVRFFNQYLGRREMCTR